MLEDPGNNNESLLVKFCTRMSKKDSKNSFQRTFRQNLYEKRHVGVTKK